MNPFKNNPLTERFSGTPDAAQPRLSEAGIEGVEARRHVRHNAYKNAYAAVNRMYPELASVPAVTANVAAAAVQATGAVSEALQYPIPENTSPAKAQNTGEKYTTVSLEAAPDKFSEPETSPADWVDQLARDAADLLQQKNGAGND